ncbi:hypothetical protein pdam_00011145 [Pocillopora damicornis]|uniref:Uncharacterized protein n=1 Tax=Pocillopora damicornis TaxID=46731 RepID=A0A3M6UMK6_POCDA|nr:hypothetical protein pdam_00011145 [Pocillopora damicornis]
MVQGVLEFKTSASAPAMKRLLQCYDGSHWYETKGNTNKRVGVPSAALALSCFTQPHPFLGIYYHMGEYSALICCHKTTDESDMSSSAISTEAIHKKI